MSDEVGYTPKNVIFLVFWDFARKNPNNEDWGFLEFCLRDFLGEKNLKFPGLRSEAEKPRKIRVFRKIRVDGQYMFQNFSLNFQKLIITEWEGAHVGHKIFPKEKSNSLPQAV